MHVPSFSLKDQLSEIGPEIKIAISRVVESGHYIGGLEVEKFENFFAETIGVNYAIGCNSGTDALILALRALNIGQGDEVITPSFSFFATAEAISNVGAKPIFIDVDFDNYLLDLRLLEGAITPATKAILPVHLFGHPVNMDEVLAFAKENDLKVIEDCAQAVGSMWRGKPVGGFGDIGCFSFFPTKNLGAIGDGGAVTTNDSHLAARIRELAVHGMPKRYFHTELGYNSRLDAIQAAVLNVKLPFLLKWINNRQNIAQRYELLLKNLPNLQVPLDNNDDRSIHSWNQFVVRVKGSSKNKKTYQVNTNIELGKIHSLLPDSSYRDCLKDSLLKCGINTIIYYPIPIHLQPAYMKLDYKYQSLKNTEILCTQVLSLPIFPELTDEEQDYVVNSIIDSI